jgi:hypothetical protein
VVSNLVQVNELTAFAINPIDAIKTTATGSTSLRYDATTSSFVYNWKTPSTRGCYTLWVNLSTGHQRNAG